VLLTAFGVLTGDNLPFFVAFNQTGDSSDSNQLTRRQANPDGVTNSQLTDSYGQYFQCNSTLS
jgi:hypothetical protein